MARIKLKNVRISFIERLFKAGQIKGVADSAVRFGANLLIAKDDPQVKVIEQAEEDAAKAKWDNKYAGVLKACRADQAKRALRDGDLKEYDGYDNHYFISGNNTKKIEVRDRDGVTRLDGSEGIIYAGCYVDAIVDIFGTTTGGNKICAALVGVQYRKKGDPLGGAAGVSDDDFESLEDDDDDI